MSRATRYATILAVAYTLAAAAYIVVSSSLAGATARTVEEVRSAEIVKGVVFVLVTGALVFGGSRTLLRRIQVSELDRAQQERALARSAARSYVGILAAAMAHEANNVLMTALRDIDAVAPEVKEQQPRLDRLRASAQRLVQLHREIAESSRPADLHEEQVVDALALVREAGRTLRVQREVFDRQVVVEGHEGVLIWAAPRLLQQLISTMILQVGTQVEDGGRISVSVTRQDCGARIDVQDGGGGRGSHRPPGDEPPLDLHSAAACAHVLGGELTLIDPVAGLGGGFRLDLSGNRDRTDA